MPGSSTTDRGYGWDHQKLREQWRPEVEAGTVDCWRCTERRARHHRGDHGWCDPAGCERDRVDVRIHPWEHWDLGHDDADPGKRTYKGPEHRLCNRRAGGEKGTERRGWKWKVKPRRRVVHPELHVDVADL